MKKITLISITFLGIYAGFAQKPATTGDSAIVKQQANMQVQPGQQSPDSLNEKASVKIFPNPAKNKVEIEIKGFEPGKLQVQLIDNNGKLVMDDKRLVFTGDEIIVLMFSEKPGLYFLVLKQGTRHLRSKLLIQ